jgi:hypothetical protein
MKNRLIIFSKNRACQLKLLLDSLLVNSNMLFDETIVIYRYDEEYQTGYEKLKREYTNVLFKYEHIFKEDVMRFVIEDSEFITLMVDDAVLYSPITKSKEEILNNIDSETICFSLRLGKNCKYSHPANINYNLGEHTINDDIMSLNFTKQPVGDLSYPLSTDGHIYKTSVLRMMLEQLNFNNPNTLEAALQKFVVLKIIPPIIKCFTESKLVSVPANLVNTTFKNRHGLEYFMSEKELEERYVGGECIDLTAMDFTDINGPHKEIKYVFKTI